MSVIVENLTKLYGNQKAIDNISFEVKTGEVVGFLGPNGAGKSTTMKIITCFMAPTSGMVKVNNYNIYDNPEEIKSHIGYLPENNPVYVDMPIVNYLSFVAELQGVEKGMIKNRIAEMIAYCGLSKEKHKKIRELSKGYRQRVGLAQALIHDPEVLILDEPTTGLDPNQIIEIRQLIKNLGKEKTVILSSHILSEVEATCDRILIINNGQIVADNTAESLRKQAEGQELLTVKIEDAVSDLVFSALMELPEIQSVEPMKEVDGLYQIQSKPNMSARRQIFDLCVTKKWYLTEMSGKETRLEDIFRDLTN